MKTMKTIKSQTYIITLLTITLTLGLSCGGGDDDPSAQELAFEMLSGSWDISQGGSIVIDGQDGSLNFQGFSLSFTDGGYTTTNAGELFGALGTWEWVDEEAQLIDLDDGKRLTLVSLTDTELVFSFQFDGQGGQANHSDSIAGSYTITVNQP